MAEPILPQDPGLATIRENKNWFMRHSVVYAVLIVAILGLAGFGYYYFTVIRKPIDIPPAPEHHETATPPPAETITLTSETTFATNSISGTLKKLDQDLKLILPSDAEQDNGISLSTEYYDGGTINSGKYLGYTRVIAVSQTDGPGGPAVYVFATIDYKTFVMDSGVPKYFVDAFKNKDNYSGINFDKVKTMDELPRNHPAVISGYGDYYLVRQQPLADYREDGVAIFSVLPSGTQSLKSNDSNLKMSVRKFSVNNSGTNNDPNYTKLLNAETKYFDTQTPIYVQDQTGLIYTYEFYPKASYEDQYKNNKDDNFYFDADNEVRQGDLADTSVPTYISYGYFLPNGCGIAPHYSLKGITDKDLVPLVQSASGQQYYGLADKNHALYQEEYYVKVSQYSDTDFKQLNKVAKPKFADYVNRNPIIITKDPWGRYVAYGETQYQILGGCGKPVVYLYPTKDTNVLVKFADNIALTKSIPSYANGWNVQAGPDGTLKDLQPQVTDCSQIDTQAFGSEYAAEACKNNSYPYLYWAGFTYNNYPAQDTGFVVAADDLEKALEEKLSYISLNDKEISDMTSYWVPKMLAKNAPYYRLSFLQNDELNKLFPMQVTPVPDSSIRVFLDWTPLSSKVNIAEQKLTSMTRHGFAYVEWGGLNK